MLETVWDKRFYRLAVPVFNSCSKNLAYVCLKCSSWFWLSFLFFSVITPIFAKFYCWPLPIWLKFGWKVTKHKIFINFPKIFRKKSHALVGRVWLSKYFFSRIVMTRVAALVIWWWVGGGSRLATETLFFKYLFM
jgi:hypothetical protein